MVGPIAVMLLEIIKADVLLLLLIVWIIMDGSRIVKMEVPGISQEVIVMWHWVQVIVGMNYK
tara:strand:- start:711 stop:896 length:186 start_codon:yes stop_codon:yes gene_type:complete